MTSRRNFVIGAGTLLTGSGTFLGSGAFGLQPSDGEDDWIPVSRGTELPERLDPSLGLTGTDDAGEEDDGADGDDGPTDAEDGDQEDGESEEPEPGDDQDPDPPDDVGDGGGPVDVPGDGAVGGGAPDGETSIRLEASGRGVLASDHVVTNGDGTLRGLRLRNLNRQAVTYVGETSDGRFPRPAAGDRVAFRVVNDGDVTVDIAATADGAAPEILNFPARADTSGGSGPLRRELTSSAVQEVAPGEALSVVVEVDTTVVDPVPPDAVTQITFFAEPV